METRTLLSGVTFDAMSGHLDITLGDSEDVTATVVGDQVSVAINGQQSSTMPAAIDVYSISVTADAGDNTVDLSGLQAVDFGYLPLMVSVTTGAGNDAITGSGMMDNIDGGDGDDVISGGAGDDTLSGGAGADVLNGDDGLDDVYGGDGDDTLWSGSGNSDGGTSSLYGDGGANLLDGTSDGSGGTNSSDIYVQIDAANYTINEGDPLNMSGYGYSTTTYESADLAWDVNNDGDYSDATGPSADFTWPELQGLGLVASTAPYTVSLRATVGAAQQFATALLTINAAAVNQAPFFHDAAGTAVDKYEFEYHLGQQWAGQARATDPDGDPLTLSSSNPNNVPFFIDTGLKVRPTRVIGGAELDQTFSFDATVTDPSGAADTVTIEVTVRNPVQAVADAIILKPEIGDASVDSPVSVITNDVVPPPTEFQVIVDTQPTKGTVTFYAGNAGFFKYTLNQGETAYPATDSFEYYLKHIPTGIICQPAQVDLYFQPQQPNTSTITADDDRYTPTIVSGQASYGFASVRDNDNPQTGGTVQLLSQTNYGTVTLNANGTFSYAPTNPNAFFAITDTFQYRLTVGTDSDDATVRLEFKESPDNTPPTPIQHAPQFTQPYFVFRVASGSIGIGDVTASDVDNDPLTYTVSGQPWLTGTPQTDTTKHTLNLQNGPAPSPGLYEASVTVTDGNNAASGQQQKDTARVYIIIEPANGAMPPTFTNPDEAGPPPKYTVTIDATAIQGQTTVIDTGKTITASDPQGAAVFIAGPSSTPDYAPPIQISANGTILVKPGGILDPNSGTVTVFASSVNGVATAEVEVTVQGVNGYTLFAQGQGDSHKVAGNDVSQGGLENCWFVGVLAALADQSPQAIEAMIRDNGGGQFDVRFFLSDANNVPTPIWISVNYNPQGNAGAAIGADIENGLAEIWPRVVELAYTQLVGGPSNVQGGFPNVAWTMLTGIPSSLQPLGDFNKANVETALNNGQSVFIGTTDSIPVLPAGLFPGHAYEVAEVIDLIPNPANPSVTVPGVRLRNPHGTNDVTISFADLTPVITQWYTL